MSRFRDYFDNLTIPAIVGVLGWLLGRWFIPPWGQIIGAFVGILIGLKFSDKVTNAFAKAKFRFRTWLLEGLEVKSELDKTLTALEQKADSVERSLEQIKSEIDTTTEAISRQKLESLNVLQACIRAYFLDGKHENVIELCDSLEQIDKENYYAYYYRGLSKAARGLHGPALPDLRKASELRKSDPNVHIGLAEVYLDLEQFEDAITEAELALKLRFRSPLEARGIIARALEEMGKFPEALAARDTCLSLSNKHAPSVEAKIRILTEMAAQGLKSWDEVFRFADESISRQPKQAGYYIFKALAYLRRNTQGDFQNAMDTFSQAETADPRDNRIYQYKGNSLLQAAKQSPNETKRDELLAEVMKCAERGIFYCRIKGYRPVFHELERKALALSGKFNEALAAVRKAVEDNPYVPWNHLKLVISLLALEKVGDAATCCEEALANADFSKAPLARLWILFVLCMAKALLWLPYEDFSEDLHTLLEELEYYQFFRAEKWSDWDELSDLINKLASKAQNPLVSDLFLLIKGELNRDVFIKNWVSKDFMEAIT